MHVYLYMGVMRRNKDGVDALEHAVQGVHTSNDHSIVRYARERGLIGASSAKVDARDETSTDSEREVIVTVRRPSSRSASRRRKT